VRHRWDIVGPISCGKDTVIGCGAVNERKEDFAIWIQFKVEATEIFDIE